MRTIPLVLFIFFASCARHHDRPTRAPSSESQKMRFGEHDPKLSSVKQFPPRCDQKMVRFFFYIELKDSSRLSVDRDPSEFEIRGMNKVLPAKVQRVKRGKYYLILESEKNISVSKLDFYVAGVKLIESFRVGLKPPHWKRTKILKLHADRSKAVLELRLQDEKGNLVETPEAPEIIVDTDVEITMLEQMGDGIWRMTLRYPYGNQLFYISVRSHGVEFKNLFRFQFIDQQ